MEINALEYKLQKLISQNYTESDFPCLYDQYLRFKNSKPFAGLKILNATPIFSNFYAKLLPLVASGADITLTSPSFINSSDEVIQVLKELGLRYLKEVPIEEKFDYVLDCGGEHVGNFARGYIELTKSGEEKFAASSKSFINVDESKSKLIEDTLGTSNGLIRALEHLKMNNFASYRVLLVGFGKVGAGVYTELIARGVELRVIDPFIDLAGKGIESIRDSGELISFNPDLVISATGVKSAITINGLVQAIKQIKPILVNLGVEDEFGEEFRISDVLNSKMPLNFILNEPTKLKYLDPTFALQNECIKYLIGSELSGKNSVPLEVDEMMCNTFNRFNS